MILFTYGALFQYKEILQVCDCQSLKNVHVNTFERYQLVIVTQWVIAYRESPT